MNLLFGFHSLPGFAQLLFNHKPSLLRSRLKTFGLPSAPMLCDVPSVPPPIQSVILLTQGIGLHLLCDQESTSTPHQVYSFFDYPTGPPWKIVTVHVLNP